MKAKYCNKNSPLAASPSWRNSPTWKRLSKVRNQANPYIRWVIGQGGVYFWDDIWIGTSAVRELCLDERGAPSTTVSDFIRNGAWDEAKLQQLHDQTRLPHVIISHILDTPIFSGEPDIPRWTLSRLGEFSLATTWETIRTHRPRIQGLEDIWRAGLTNSIAIFNWRLLSNRIPVDSKLQWRKIELASKCQCCPRRPNSESLQHLFVRGWGATCVWREFDGWFEGSVPSLWINDPIPDRIVAWSLRIQQQDRKHLCRIMPYFILWFIWAERNRSRHEQVQFKPFNVVCQVQMFLHNNMANGHIKPKQWRGVKLRMSIPNQLETRGPRPIVMPIKWQPPDRPWIKLNTDGAYMVATDKGGGCRSGLSGKMLVTFATPLDAHSVREAELLALHHGLVVAKEYNQPIWIELDAEQAIKLLNGNTWGPVHVC
ncbi:uncharacterized protein LOC121800868 [Salvia splendens]|uniref:uncharacterized protein LOC121800868 n=1 Tax=Salvia splendens TaxID=180675 RepID=UPI001C273407|nr:uncharacterized protein LOC121800868 [Salvia splendens]